LTKKRERRRREESSPAEGKTDAVANSTLRMRRRGSSAAGEFSRKRDGFDFVWLEEKKGRMVHRLKENCRVPK